MEFEKIGNRYKLIPEQRILKVVKHEQEISISKLQRETFIQFDVLKSKLEKLQSEGKILIKIEKVKDNGTIISTSRTIKWMDKMQKY